MFYSPARLAVCEASTKAGKTAGALRWLIGEALADKEPTSSLYLTYVYKQAEKMFERLERWLKKMDPDKTVWFSNKTKLCITVKHGGFESLIWFMGSDNYDAVYGSDYVRVVVDEASRMRPEAWHAARSTTTATQGKIRIIGNVRGRRNWAYQLARKAEAGGEGMSYHKMTADDAVKANLFPKEEIESAARDLPPETFRELYYAEAADEGSNPFGVQAIRDCVGEVPAGKADYWGVDLARSVDWTVCCGLSDGGGVVEFERWRGPDWSNIEQRVALLVSESVACVDSTGVGDAIVERLARTCPGVTGFTFTSRSKQQLMLGLASAINRRAITIPDDDQCKPLIDELLSFEYEYRPRDGGVSYCAPSGSHDDCVMALALAVRCADLGAAESASVEVVRQVAADPFEDTDDWQPVGRW